MGILSGLLPGPEKTAKLSFNSHKQPVSLTAADRAIADALCPTFSALAAGSAVLPYVSLGSGPVAGAVISAAPTVSALSVLGMAATCGPVEIGPDPNNGLETGCSRAEGPTTITARLTDGSEQGKSVGTNAVSIDGMERGFDQFGYHVWKVSYTKADGSKAVGESIRGVDAPPPQRIYLETNDDNPCLEGPDPTPIPPMPDVPVHEYTDPETNCNYKVTFQGLIQESPDGPILPVFEVEGGPVNRADGGVMGGCVMNPTIYVSPPQGPNGPDGPPIPPIPRPPDQPPTPPFPPGPDGGDGIPWWAKALATASTAALLNQLMDLITKPPVPNFAAGSFTLEAPCDEDDDGNALTRTWNFPSENFYSRVISHQKAGLEALQTHLNWKTPICQPERPALQGEWITTRWISDEPMDHSGRRLRKLFRYRSQSSRELQQLSSYWESFFWNAGNVCVIHKGAWWGTPQVWAESAEEGKRVIRFAGAEAGIDPDQTGRWEISGSRSPRIGMSGTMRILRHKGFPWVASRDGADWPNILAKEP